LNIYVGNLSFDTTDDSLRAAFATHGAVDSARVITDRESGRSRGFGFVEMSDDGEANAAMGAINGTMLDGREVNVNEARPREDRRGGGGGGGGYGGGGGGGGRRW
jgi:RNA recognition motif-containing protein